MKNRICCIIGAGEFDSSAFKYIDGAYYIAADGGYDYMTRLGINPDVIIGDFDSTNMPKHDNVEVYPVMKDDTDMLLAVKKALKMKFDTIYIYGGTGGRPDHTIANISTLCYIANRGARGYLKDKNYIYTVIKNGRILFDKKHKGKISVFCIGDYAFGVNEKGLKYSLKNKKLTNDVAIGVSNEFAGKTAEISVKNGEILIMWERNI